MKAEQLKSKAALLMLALALCAAGCRDNTPDMSQEPPRNKPNAGLRASRYGAPRPFPPPQHWLKAAGSMNARVKGAQPAFIWLVGVMDGEEASAAKSNPGDFSFNGGVRLNFPSPGGVFENISFSETDENREYLDLFDKEGARVWLQVESANADMPTLIRLVLDRYGRRPCVAGFGVDVEWRLWSQTQKEGVAITDLEASAWSQLVRAYNRDFKIFFKHWLQEKMSPTYRDRVMFLDDSQGFSCQEEMIREFTAWGQYFYPAAVGFQFGYPADQHWWKSLQDPPGDIGKALIHHIPNVSDVYWVDFTMGAIWP